MFFLYKINIFKLKFVAIVSTDKNAFHQVFAQYLEKNLSDFTTGFL